MDIKIFSDTNGFHSAIHVDLPQAKFLDWVDVVLISRSSKTIFISAFDKSDEETCCYATFFKNRDVAIKYDNNKKLVEITDQNTGEKESYFFDIIKDTWIKILGENSESNR